jgi:hypothetical protein
VLRYLFGTRCLLPLPAVDLSVVRRALLPSSSCLVGGGPCVPVLLLPPPVAWPVMHRALLPSSSCLAGGAPCTPALFLSPPVAWPVQHRACLHSDPAAWSVVHRAFLHSDPVPCWTAPSRVSDLRLHGVARGCSIYGCGLVSLSSCPGLVGGGESPSGVVARMSRWTPTRVGSAPCQGIIILNYIVILLLVYMTSL